MNSNKGRGYDGIERETRRAQAQESTRRMMTTSHMHIVKNNLEPISSRKKVAVATRAPMISSQCPQPCAHDGLSFIFRMYQKNQTPASKQTTSMIVIRSAVIILSMESCPKRLHSASSASGPLRLAVPLSGRPSGMADVPCLIPRFCPKSRYTPRFFFEFNA